jgi:hypothetical protein
VAAIDNILQGSDGGRLMSAWSNENGTGHLRLKPAKADLGKKANMDEIIFLILVSRY